MPFLNKKMGLMIQDILQLHANRYPLMQPGDAVKLLFQNEFGIGHLIPDRMIFAERLISEYKQTEIIPGIPLFEPIGNGLIRVMLNSPDRKQINLEGLTQACFQTAEHCSGSAVSFKQKLELLQSECALGLFGFDTDELTRYLTKYEKEGYPPVSHSKIYHDAYHPSYRVVAESLFMTSQKA